MVCDDLTSTDTVPYNDGDKETIRGLPVHRENRDGQKDMTSWSSFLSDEMDSLVSG